MQIITIDEIDEVDSSLKHEAIVTGELFKPVVGNTDYYIERSMNSNYVTAIEIPQTLHLVEGLNILPLGIMLPSDIEPGDITVDLLIEGPLTCELPVGEIAVSNGSMYLGVVLKSMFADLPMATSMLEKGHKIELSYHGGFIYVR